MAEYKWTLKLSFLVIPLLVITTSCSDHKKDRKDITLVWKNFKEYNSNNIGEESVKLIDSSTLNYYSNMLSLIKNADSITVERLRSDQKILVLGVRHSATNEKILGMKDGEALFIYCVQSGLIGSKSDDGVFLKILSVKNNLAKVQFVDTNNKPGLLFEFRKENELWKINLTTVYANYANNTWQAIIEQSGKTEREYLYSILEFMTGEKPKNRIWHPVK